MKHRLAIALTVLGLLQMSADFAGLTALKGLAAATCASPAPKVFSAVQGLETYSTRFFIEWTDAQGTACSLALTPATYAKLEGPYNRRNVFGAVMAYAPVLSTNERTRALFESVARYALCGNAPVLRELGLDPSQVHNLCIRLEPLPGTDLGALPQRIEAPCR